MAVAGIMIGLFYGLKKDGWGKIEYYWEGALGIFAAMVISWMGAVLLRVSKMQEKWRAKISKALEDKPVSTNVNGGRFKRWCEKYALFILPFITVLREGVEAIVFVGGVIFQAPATAIPLPVVVGLAAGLAVGYLLYK
jgi:high-affinity iron transporter